jgi:hypothetical protein
LTSCGARRSKAYALAPSKCTKYGYFGKKYGYFIHKIAIFKYFCVFLKHKSAGFGGMGPQNLPPRRFFIKKMGDFLKKSPKILLYYFWYVGYYFKITQLLVVFKKARL